MNAETRTRVGEVLCEVIERMAFMFGDPVEKSLIPPDAAPALQVDMEFNGPVGGRLTVASPLDAAVEIAANILGREPDDPVAALCAPDAFGELINVVCGALLTELAGTEPVFRLTVPRACRIGTESWNELRDAPDTDAFLVDGHPLLFRLVLE